MRKMFIVTAALAITFASFSSAEAAGRNRGFSPRSQTQTRTYRVWRGGVFDRLLQMERRKNEIIFGGFRR